MHKARAITLLRRRMVQPHAEDDDGVLLTIIYLSHHEAAMGDLAASVLRLTVASLAFETCPQRSLTVRMNPQAIIRNCRCRSISFHRSIDCPAGSRSLRC
jgi:hypothetical protein